MRLFNLKYQYWYQPQKSSMGQTINTTHSKIYSKSFINQKLCDQRISEQESESRQWMPAFLSSLLRCNLQHLEMLHILICICICISVVFFDASADGIQE